jgi:hypothetical protein
LIITTTLGAGPWIFVAEQIEEREEDTIVVHTGREKKKSGGIGS